MGDGGGGHWLVRMEWCPAGWSVCLPLLIFPCTVKSRSSLLAPAHAGGPGKRAVKRLWCGGYNARDCLRDTSVLCRRCSVYSRLSRQPNNKVSVVHCCVQCWRPRALAVTVTWFLSCCTAVQTLHCRTPAVCVHCCVPQPVVTGRSSMLCLESITPRRSCNTLTAAAARRSLLLLQRDISASLNYSSQKVVDSARWFAVDLLNSVWLHLSRKPNLKLDP